MSDPTNPFSVTRAVDLKSSEIESLWVDSGGSESRDSLFQPTSPVPLLILGGKGSGKTHLMRYYSYTLQTLRHAAAGQTPLEGLREDGYLGIYVLLGGLNAQRFSGRGQADDVWQALYEYAFELSLSRELLEIVVPLLDQEVGLAEVENDICTRIAELVDAPPAAGFSTLRAVLAWIAERQRELDLDMNNVVFTGRFTTSIVITRGRLLFGIPRVLAECCDALKDVRFSYQLDELEMLSERQQIFVQTLLRERADPATFRIGARMYGVLTLMTLGSSEENREGSEFDQVILDQRIRESGNWPAFAERLVTRRLLVARGTANAASNESDFSVGDLKGMFDVPDYGWRSPTLHARLGSPAGVSGRHFDRFRRRLERGMAIGSAPGVVRQEHIDEVLAAMQVAGMPLLEKLNMLLVFQEWFRGRDIRVAAAQVALDCAAFLKTPSDASVFRQALQHYSSDLLAQLFRDFHRSVPVYLGFATMVEMAECLPRSLMTILKDSFAWSIYDGRHDRPMRLSEEDQVRGVMEASEWFLKELRKPGAHGPAIRIGIERLARLFEANRYADKPVEVSLSAFAVAESKLKPEAAELLRMAEHRSLLIRSDAFQIDRNSGERLSKFQLNGMLAPKWGLPISRRGVATFAPEIIEMLFDPDRETEYATFLSAWQSRMTAPTFGRAAQRLNEPGLFDSL